MTDLAALLKLILESKRITIIIEDGQPMVDESSANAQFAVRCEKCGKTFVKPKQASAERALRSHRYHCQRKPLPKKNRLLDQIEEMVKHNGAKHYD